MFKFIPINVPHPEIPNTQADKDRYRFGAYKYGLRGTAKYGPDDYIPQEKSLYSYPSKDGEDTSATDAAGC